jgi:hypothetical protein
MLHFFDYFLILRILYSSYRIGTLAVISIPYV